MADLRSVAIINVFWDVFRGSLIGLKLTHRKLGWSMRELGWVYHGWVRSLGLHIPDSLLQFLDFALVREMATLFVVFARRHSSICFIIF